MNSIIKKTICVILILITLVLGIYYATKALFIVDDNIRRWNSFNQYDKDTLDIIFIGNSHGFSSHIPMIYDQKLEVDTFNLCNTGITAYQNYYQLKEVFRQQSPKIILLEFFALSSTDILDNYAPKRYYYAFNGMPFAMPKIEAMMAFTRNDMTIGEFVPMSSYHIRWKEKGILKHIERKMTSNGYLLSKHNGLETYGRMYSDDVEKRIANDRQMITDRAIIDNQVLELLNRIIKLCDDNDASLIIVATPYAEQFDVSSDIELAWLNGIEDYVETNDIDLVDLYSMQDELGLNATHLSDGGHINYFGANIISEYLSQYILENYSTTLINSDWDYKEDSAEKLKNLVQAFDDETTVYGASIGE